MSASKIEWTGRSDWNAIRGCTRVSPGCGGPGPHGGCYAEAIAGRFSDPATADKPAQAFHGFATRTAAGGRWTGKVEIVEDRLTLPMRWRKPALIFASSTSDIFHEKLSDHDIDRLFAVMALTPRHTYQILTKRPARMREYLTAKHGYQCAAWKVRVCAVIDEMIEWRTPTSIAARTSISSDKPLPNVWLGVSVEDQQRADERREDLRNTPAAVRFVSYEPALGPVDWTGWASVDWIISGGESGPRARPSHPDWHRATRDFCAANDIAYLFKQWGEYGPHNGEGGVAGAWLDPNGHYYGGPTSWPPAADERRAYMIRWGKKAAGRLLDGVRHDGFPK
jgi:protein gp37